MRKISIYATAIIVLFMVTYIGYNLYNNNQHVDFKSYYNDNNKNPEMEYLTLQEIRDEKDNILEKLYGGYYENLSAAQVIVSLSDGDYVTEMKEYDGGVYHGITDPKEMYEEQMRVIHYFMGDDLDSRYLEDGNCLRNNGEDIFNLYLRNDEVIDYIENGTYSEIASFSELPAMFYDSWTRRISDDRRHCEINDLFIYVPVMKGKYMELADTFNEDPKTEFDSVATYYPDGDNLDDEYELDNGSISIADAIKFAEYYWAECMPFDTAEDVEKKVRQVEVYQLKNGKYCIYHEMTRKFKGLMFEYEHPFDSRAGLSWWLDYGRTIMVDTDDIDELLGTGNGFVVEETGKKSYEAVSLKSAMDKVSDKIGNNSKYEVQRIEMIYRQKIVAYENNYAEFKGIPCWRIQCKNQSNDMITMFYINLIDGSISYITE
ncbi:MAG: hypothetical protein K2M60_01930 [Lachnospiraceae bacterium]|nr:hypothetical protein [Lachnospiraceae bacterium]